MVTISKFVKHPKFSILLVWKKEADHVEGQLEIFPDAIVLGAGNNAYVTGPNSEAAQAQQG